ncbi:winged helix-turn-helix domain-containing protein [Kitasatospora sp. NPDC085895]|uniref:GntR family transcriptional regulator n=1 Tax=Kitasatospora sp. NPDC085895 TaxID=3155057 RepID=UPI00344C690E
MTIAADSPRQPYEQLSDLLRKQILSGDIQPGEKLLSVRQLAEKHKTTTTTVQKAINVLRTEGLVLTSGRGSFARDPKEAQVAGNTPDVRELLRRLDDYDLQLSELRDRVAALEEGQSGRADDTK